MDLPTVPMSTTEKTNSKVLQGAMKCQPLKDLKQIFLWVLQLFRKYPTKVLKVA